MKLHRVPVVVVAVLASLLCLGGVASATGLLDAKGQEPAPDPSPAATAASGPTALMLQLEGKAAAVVPASREQAQADANAALAAAVATQADEEGLIDSELFRVGVAYNGVGVIASPADAEELAEIPGVKSVAEIPAMKPTNSHSVPYIGGDDAWESQTSPGLTGQGVTIAVIDSGVDYVHKDFGGPGTGAAYSAARAAGANVAADPDVDPTGFTVESGGDQIYPTPKVVGGFDFVGDNYGSTPTAPAEPDANPLDCGTALGGSGHGTHVAGTAGGLGVNADGSTFTGDYTTLDPIGMRIGPGVAPGAELYALRVFGCDGSTNMVIPAIDWAMDPNRDGNSSDHLDVVNMSLGSDFGMPDDPTAKAVSNASDAGMVMVIAAGNSGNTSNIVGSPGSSPDALTVANGNTGAQRDAIEVSGTAGGAGDGVKDVSLSASYPWEDLSSPVSAPVVWANETGCSALSSGTYSGKIALLRWSSDCGSAVRSNNAEGADAVGALLLDDVSSSTIAIAGNATLPTAYVINPVGSDLKAAAMGAGATVTFDRSLAGSFDASAAGTMNDSSSRGPGVGGAPKPDITAPGTSIRSAKSGTGDYFMDSTGTSMAAPHVSGAVALLVQDKPGWSVEDLKAAAMNTADPDIDVAPGLAGTGSQYPPQRAGTGMINVPNALATDVIAKASPGTGEVGVGFGQLQVPIGSPFERSETVTLTNHGGSPEEYAASFLSRNLPSGVDFEVVGGPTVTVPAGGSTTVDVRISVPSPSALRNDRDATLSENETLSNDSVRARRYEADASGLLRFESTGSAPDLSVPVHATVRPATEFDIQNQVSIDSGSNAGSAVLSGTSVFTGSTPTDWQSRISMFELQAVSPRATLGPGVPEYAHAGDIRAVGVSADESGYLSFGIESDTASPQPATYGRFEIGIDNDGDGDEEYWIYNSRWSLAGMNAPKSDTFGTGLYDVAADQTYIYPPRITGASPGYGEFGARANVISIPAAAVAVTNADSDFSYTVEGYANRVSGMIDSVGPLEWDALDPGFARPSAYFVQEAPPAFTFRYYAAAAVADGALGMLIFHHLNQSSDQAEIVEVNGQPTVVAGGPYSGNEGSTIDLNASGSSDPEGDTLSYSWDLDDNGTYETSGATPPLALADGPATRTVGLRVSDGISDPVERDLSISVSNVVPTVSVSALGSPATGVRVTASDPSAPDRAAGFTYRVDVGANGSIDRTVTGGATVDVPLTLPSTPTVVRVTATDKDAGVSASRQVTVSGPSTPPPPPPVLCVVPKLKGLSLKAADAALEDADCTLGTVKKPPPKKRKGKLVVATQSKPAGTELPEDSGINIKLKKKRK